VKKGNKAVLRRKGGKKAKDREEAPALGKEEGRVQEIIKLLKREKERERRDLTEKGKRGGRPYCWRQTKKDRGRYSRARKKGKIRP